ncbi:cyclase family protein [Glaciihabitans arcticus]|uniref:Cyclase family protein n=1 Tax=Glaciihabitans arcticus TaxID=2668039 RepID=A0A4Q9GTD3_9MICO|nr:cyclase family protein [Glaciihabitans arcticus]TBN55480.1 cyclase family protein [Glaciihabitans arcticus]
MSPSTDLRAHFDATVEFNNGGGLTATGFRLDLPNRGADVAQLFVKHLGLALVKEVTLSNLAIVEEQHRGSRGVAGPRTRTGRFVELSHVIRDGLVTYPGLPAPVITPHLTREASKASYAPGTEFAMDIITMIGNTGTYLDSPFHRYEGGTDLAGLTLETLVDQPAEVFHVHDSTTRGIDAPIFWDRDLANKAVLIHTGWDAQFGTPEYGSNAPYLTEAGARYLVEQGVTMVGIDSVNIDNTAPDAAGARPAHTLLLAAGVHVVEHLTNLGELPPSGATFSAVPPRVEAFGTFPVRAYARL